MIVIAHFSDTHLDGSQHRADRAAAVLAYLDGLAGSLAAILVTGDIADHGLPAEYEQARDILSSSAHPVFCCPGNHDDRGAFAAVMLGEGGGAGPAGAPVNRVHQTAGAVFALCDSTIPGRDDGYLAEETIGWLDDQLAGRPLLAGPGVASTLLLPWERGGIADEQAPVTVAFHILGEDGRMTTHHRTVPADGGPRAWAMSCRSPACRASPGRASRGVAVVTSSSAIRSSSSALRPMPPPAARDGQDRQHTA